MAKIKMTAIRDFRGRPGEGSGEKNRMVEVGDTVVVTDQGRADYLQKAGLATVAGGKMETKKGKNKAEAAAPSNKAEPVEVETKEKDADPLEQKDGQIGSDNFASLSEPDRQPQKKTSATSKKRGGKARK